MTDSGIRLGSGGWLVAREGDSGNYFALAVDVPYATKYRSLNLTRPLRSQIHLLMFWQDSNGEYHVRFLSATVVNLADALVQPSRRGAHRGPCVMRCLTSIRRSLGGYVPRRGHIGRAAVSTR